MKHILFIRHTESTDDLDNQYGGWADFNLTEHGVEQMEATASKIKDLKIKFDKVLTSPLRRAKDGALIIAKALELEVEETVYLKEKNGYGLISGMNKDEALTNYPELVKKLDEGYCPGAEPEEKFVERVKFAIDRLKNLPYENIIAVTHGGFLSRMMQHILHKKYIKAGDGGMLLVKVQDDKLSIVNSDHFSYE